MSSKQQTFDSIGGAIQSGDDPDTEPQFAVGERVVDTTAENGEDEIEVMRVLDPDAGTAGEVKVGETGVTVSEYEGNEDVDRDDRVVECVYEGYLDGNVSGWEDAPASELPEFLAEFAEEWKIPIRSYSYPEKHLSTDVDKE
jgi:hypothetical protein